MQMTCGDVASPAHISISFIVTGITFVIVNSTICSHHLIQVGERLWADDLAIAPLLHSDALLADVKWNEAEGVEGTISLPIWLTKHLAVI